MKRKNGFTLIEMLGVMILLGILTTLAVSSYSSYLTKTKIKAFTMEEKSMRDATESAYIDCVSNHPNNTFCKNHSMVDTIGETDTVYLKELIQDQYIDIIKNPYDTEEECDMEKSYVFVEKSNTKTAYQVCLICGKNKSNECK